MNDMTTTPSVLELVDRLAAAAPGSPDELATINEAVQWRVHLQTCAEMLRRTIRNNERVDAQNAEVGRMLARIEEMLAAVEAATHGKQS